MPVAQLLTAFYCNKTDLSATIKKAVTTKPCQNEILDDKLRRGG
jgi:hypothetical protein